ncbi:hypothetical protein HPB48_007536 [Haemaphysalis longicornis]|uniref:Peptidase M14 domain-containing protein n=1 Tax=Haemaphysalis longicornis TaxID=44386 RepID=A0A9J6FYM5_HAELO|nr:hypothetical protein HPB48_007536 [Haemaphysalis longicornis]
MALHLVEYMVHNQESDPDVHWLLNNVRIHVVPSVNVDGSDASIPGDCSGMTGGYTTHVAEWPMQSGIPKFTSKRP